MRTGQTLEVEEEYPDETGKPQYLRVVKSPVFGPDGKIMGTQGMLFDITERKRAEAELAYERDLLRTLLDNSTDHIYFKDAQSRFIKSSQIQARQFGLTSADELVGKSDFDFFTEEHARLAFEAEQQIIRTGQPMIGKIEKESWQDGRRESWVLTTKMPVRNKAGEIVGTFGISKDITALKQTEGELSYERDLLRALMNTIPDSIYFKDLQSRFVRVSKSKLVRTFAACLKQQRAASELTDLPAHLTSLEQFAKYFFGKTDLDFFREKIQVRLAKKVFGELLQTGQVRRQIRQLGRRPLLLQARGEGSDQFRFARPHEPRLEVFEMNGIRNRIHQRPQQIPLVGQFALGLLEGGDVLGNAEGADDFAGLVADGHFRREHPGFPAAVLP